MTVGRIRNATLRRAALIVTAVPALIAEGALRFVCGCGDLIKDWTRAMKAVWKGKL